MIFAVFVFAGIASPSPDPLTMLLLAVPCLVLVEISEVIIWLNDRRRAARRVPCTRAWTTTSWHRWMTTEPIDQHRLTGIVGPLT